MYTNRLLWHSYMGLLEDINSRQKALFVWLSSSGSVKLVYPKVEMKPWSQAELNLTREEEEGAVAAGFLFV